MNKSSIMTSAWVSAKLGARRFGGSPKEYFPAALKQAWKAYKIRQAIYEERMGYDKENNTITPEKWIAEITGTHPVYKLDRKFINGQKTVKLENDKIYNWVGYKGENHFGKIVDGKLQLLAKEEVLELVS